MRTENVWFALSDTADFYSQIFMVLVYANVISV